MRIAIIGSRTFHDYDYLEKKVLEGLQELHEEKEIDVEKMVIVSGGCYGADRLAERFADTFGLRKDIYLPDNKIKNNSKFYYRDEKIVDNCDFIFAFKKGTYSPGTELTLEIARKKGRRYVIFRV